MKKFFKALALVLALTLVIGTIPAAAAETDYSMKYKTKKLYVGEKRGWKEENGEVVYSKYLSKVSYAKAIIGIANKADAVDKEVTAKSSDNSIVSTHNKAKRIEAEGIGSATVTYYVGGKEIGSILYKVRKTATNDTVYFNRQITEDTKEVIVGSSYEVSLPRSIDKVQQDTDQRRLYATDKDGNKVDEKKVIITPVEGAERLWTVKFVEVGEYILVGEAYQSDDSYPGTTGKATVSVTAAKAKPVDVKQTASNQFQIIFDEGVVAGSVIDENTLETGDIYYIIPNTEAETPFSLISKVDPKDNIVTVTMFQDFVSGTKYYVKAENKVFDFTATGNTINDVDSIVITKTAVEAGNPVKLDYTIYNKLGIDITHAIDTTNPGAVEIEIVKGDDVAQMASPVEIQFENPDKAAVVKAKVFIGYDEENDYKEIIVPGVETTITSYDGSAKATKIVSSIAAIDPTKYINKDVSVVNWFAKGDQVEVQSLAIMSSGDPQKLSLQGFKTVKSANENILTVTYGSTVDNAVLVGNSVGTTQVVFYKENSDGTESAAWAFTVTVKDARKASKISAKFTQLNLNTGFASDETTLEVSVIDQYDKAYHPTDDYAASITVEQNANNAKQNGAYALGGLTWDGNSSTYKLTIKGGAFKPVLDGTLVDLTTSKNYMYTAKIGNSLSATSRFTAQAVGVTPSGYSLNVSTLALDTSVLKDTKAASAEITVSGTNNGYKTGLEDLWVVGTAPDKTKAATTIPSGAGIYVVLTDKNGNAVTADTNLIKIADQKITITNVTGSALTATTKLDAGNYTVKAYLVKGNATDGYSVSQISTTKVIKVADAQKNVDYTKKSDKGKTVADCFEFSFNGNKDIINSYVFTTVLSSTNTVFVDSAKVYVQTDNLGVLECNVTIGKVITLE